MVLCTSCFEGSKDRGRYFHYPGIATFSYERQAISGHNLQYGFTHFVCLFIKFYTRQIRGTNSVAGNFMQANKF